MKDAQEHAAKANFNLPPPPPSTAEEGDESRKYANAPGMIPGSGVIGIHRDENGNTVNRYNGLYFIPVKLTTIAACLHPGGIWSSS